MRKKEKRESHWIDYTYLTLSWTTVIEALEIFPWNVKKKKNGARFQTADEP